MVSSYRFHTACKYSIVAVMHKNLGISACLYLQMLIPLCKPINWELVAVQIVLSRCNPNQNMNTFSVSF